MHPKNLSDLNIDVTCEVKVRSNVKIRRFDVLGPGDRDYRFSLLKLRRNVLMCMVKVCYDYISHAEERTRSGYKRSLYVKIVIESCDTCFMVQFRRRSRKSWLLYHSTLFCLEKNQN